MVCGREWKGSLEHTKGHKRGELMCLVTTLIFMLQQRSHSDLQFGKGRGSAGVTEEPQCLEIIDFANKQTT